MAFDTKRLVIGALGQSIVTRVNRITLLGLGLATQLWIIWVLISDLNPPWAEDINNPNERRLRPYLNVLLWYLRHLICIIWRNDWDSHATNHYDYRSYWRFRFSMKSKWAFKRKRGTWRTAKFVTNRYVVIVFCTAASKQDTPSSVVHFSRSSWWRHEIETFPALLAFVRGIHRSPVISLHKGQWRGALKFSLICAWIHGWVNNRKAGDLRRHHAHYDVTAMWLACFHSTCFSVWPCVM